MKKQKNNEIPIEVEFTEGYQERFTKAILKIHEKRLHNAETKNNSEPQQQKVS